MILDEITFPVYVIGTENITYKDGVIFADAKVIDDTNMKGKSLGIRRLQTELPYLYDLRYMIKSKAGLVRHRGFNYIDWTGKLFEYRKRKYYTLKYHKIENVSKKDIVSLVWLKGIPYPIEAERPPEIEYRWAGLIYKNNMPWFFWHYSTEWRKDSRRKI